MRRLILCILLTLLMAGCQSVGVPTSTPLPTAVASPVMPTMPVATSTPVPTLTPVPTMPPATATPGLSPVTTPTVAPAPTLASVTPLPTGVGLNCPVLPLGGFLVIWNNYPELRAALDCPSSHHPRIVPDAWPVKTAYEPFEHGAMIWSDRQGWYSQPIIYVLHPDGTFGSFGDTYRPGVDPVNGGEHAPAGLFEPSLGLGKLWRTQPDVRAALGWATAPEQDGGGRFEMFLQGNMVWLAQTDKTYVLLTFMQPATYRVIDVPFTAGP